MEKTRDGKTWHKAERWETFDEECDFLYGLVRAVKPRGVLETGTYKGKATTAIARALEENGFGIIHTVDREGCPEPLMAPGPVVWHLGESPYVLDSILSDMKQPLELAFLDSNHDTETVYRELCAVHEHLVPGGYIAVHDVLYAGHGPNVREAIATFMDDHPGSYFFMVISSCAGIGLLMRLR